MHHLQSSLLVPLLLALLLLLLLSSQQHQVTSLTTSKSSEAAQLTRSRLSEALSSPSGKLTLSPEIVIPEPASPTAILLQNSAVTQLSESLRTKAKANTAFLQTSSISSLKTFCNEQELARGNFPGPVPVIYCKKETEQDDSQDDDNDNDNLSELAELGVSGVIVPTTCYTSDSYNINDDERFLTIMSKGIRMWIATNTRNHY